MVWPRVICPRLPHCCAEGQAERSRANSPNRSGVARNAVNTDCASARARAPFSTAIPVCQNQVSPFKRYESRTWTFRIVEFHQRHFQLAFGNWLAAEVAEAEGFLRRGLPLVKMMPPEFELDVMLFVHGGLALLGKIRQVDYDVWTRRPVLSKFEKLCLAIRCWWQLRHPPEQQAAEEPEET